MIEEQEEPMSKKEIARRRGNQIASQVWGFAYDEETGNLFPKAGKRCLAIRKW